MIRRYHDNIYSGNSSDDDSRLSMGQLEDAIVKPVIEQIVKNLNHVPSHIEGKFEEGEEWIRLQDAIDAVEAEG